MKNALSIKRITDNIRYGSLISVKLRMWQLRKVITVDGCLIFKCHDSKLSAAVDAMFATVAVATRDNDPYHIWDTIPEKVVTKGETTDLKTLFGKYKYKQHYVRTLERYAPKGLQEFRQNENGCLVMLVGGEVYGHLMPIK